MRVFALEHVEATLRLGVRVGAGLDKQEARRRVDEPPNEPGAGQAIDVKIATRDPEGAAPSRLRAPVRRIARRSRQRAQRELDPARSARLLDLALDAVADEDRR